MVATFDSALGVAGSTGPAAVPSTLPHPVAEATILSVVVPAHREGSALVDAIATLRASLQAFPGRVEVIISLDGPDEATAAAAAETGAIVVREAQAHGKGHAVRTGFAEASGTLLAYIDADMELDPRAMLGLIDLVEQGAAGAVASKWHPASSVTYPWTRRMQSRAYRLIVRTLFGLALSDTQAGLKVFRADAVRPILPALSVDGFAFDIELLAALHDRGAHLVEGPVEVNHRSGASTAGATAGLRVLVETLRVWRRRRSGLPPFDPTS